MKFRTVAVLAAAMLAPSITSVGVQAQTGISVPAGFYARVYAAGLASPTAMSFGPDGRLYVAEVSGVILAINSAGPTVVTSGFTTPLGLAWHGRTLFVSSTGQVATLTPTSGYRSFRKRVIVSGLPTGKHQNDGMAFRGSWIYLGVGSTCNACVERDARSATIMRFHLDGTHAQIYSHGLRNPYGLAFRPATGQLYATDNGRDDYGNSVPDELNQITNGSSYGWPDCWGNRGGSRCDGTRAPVALFEPHSSADGLTFYAGRTFPTRYRSDAFVAEWGDSVNSLGTGQIVKAVSFVGNRATVSTFATGFTHPLAVTMAPGGALLIADFGSGIIWAIQANRH